MDYQVIYYSKTGHTKKVAEAIASELDVIAEDVSSADLDADALVFLGSGCYGGNPSKDMTKFILDSDFKSRSVALFGTSGSGEGKEVNEMEKVLSSKEALIKGKFFCKGQILLKNRGRPNEEDLEGAREFARRMKE